MTNEKDREEADKMACVLADHGGDSDFGHAAFVREIARIRAEAAKAEWGALDKILSKMSLLSAAIDAYDWSIVKTVWDDVMEVIDSTLPAILSDDQEAGR